MVDSRFPRAVLYLKGRLVPEGGGRHRLEVPGLPENFRLSFSKRFAGYARRIEGQERVFVAYPRTGREGGVVTLFLASAHEQPPEGFTPGEGEVVGRLVYASKDRLVVEVVPRAPGKPFRVTLDRKEDPLPRFQKGTGIAVRLRMEGGRLVSTLAEPVTVLVAGTETEEVLAEALPQGERPLAKEKKIAPSPSDAPEPGGQEAGAAKPPAKSRKKRPDRVRVWRSEETPEPLLAPPPLAKGQLMGITGSGPYYLVVRPELAERWEKVEASLDRFPVPHRLLTFPDGTRALECADREALRVFYKSLFRL